MDIKVFWRAQAGPDRMCRVSFTVTDQNHAQEVSGILDSWLSCKGYPVLTNYISHPQQWLLACYL